MYKYQKDVWSQQIDALVDKLNQKKHGITNDGENETEEVEADKNQAQEISIKFQLFCKIKPQMNHFKINRN